MIKKDCRQSSRRSPRDGYCILADVISTEMGLLSPCHSTICHSAKFDMLVAALVNRCIECGLHLILNKQGPTGGKIHRRNKRMQLFVLFGINWTTPFNLKQSDPMAIIEGIQ